MIFTVFKIIYTADKCILLYILCFVFSLNKEILNISIIEKGRLMKKLSMLIVILLSSGFLFAFQFAWLSDTHIAQSGTAAEDRIVCEMHAGYCIRN
jgi:hypothetical protein